jgi:hypothetical protein
LPLRLQIERLAEEDPNETVRAAAARMLNVLNAAGGHAPSLKP